MTPFSCSMTHFTALNGHGKLSALGRVSPAAGPCPTCFNQEGTFFFFFLPAGFNKQVAQDFSSKHIHTCARLWLRCYIWTLLSMMELKSESKPLHGRRGFFFRNVSHKIKRSLLMWSCHIKAFRHANNVKISNMSNIPKLVWLFLTGKFVLIHKRIL